MRSRKKTPRGFTLLELLVALVVMTIMLSLVATLLRSFMDQTGRARFVYGERIMAFNWLNTALGSMFFYTIVLDPTFIQPEQFVDFFNGQPESLQFITASPLILQGIALERLYLENHVLYMNETPIYSYVNDYMNPHETKETAKVPIFDGIDKIHWTYTRSVERVFLNVNEKAKASTARQTDSLQGEIPEIIKLSITFHNGHDAEWDFRPKSDFRTKKGITYRLYGKF